LNALGLNEEQKPERKVENEGSDANALEGSTTRRLLILEDLLAKIASLHIDFPVPIKRSRLHLPPSEWIIRVPICTIPVREPATGTSASDTDCWRLWSRRL